MTNAVHTMQSLNMFYLKSSKTAITWPSIESFAAEGEYFNERKLSSSFQIHRLNLLFNISLKTLIFKLN